MRLGVTRGMKLPHIAMIANISERYRFILFEFDGIGFGVSNQ